MFEWRWITNDEALEIVEWDYKGEYSFYNLYEDEHEIDEFLNPFRWNHYAVVYEEGQLVGFYRYVIINIDEVEIELGLHPDLTGQGKGVEFTKYAMELAKTRYDPKKFIIKVAEFNERAIKIFKRVGFQEVSRFQQELNGSVHQYVRLERSAEEI